jgi:hypothetical protein
VIRETIDLFLSCIDRRKVDQVFQLWFVTFLTVMAGVVVTTSGYEPWDPPAYLVVWLAAYLTLEGLIALGFTLLSIWLVGRELQQPSLQVMGEQSEPALWTTFPQAEESWPRVSDPYEDPDGFWDIPPDDMGAPHE